MTRKYIGHVCVAVLSAAMLAAQSNENETRISMGGGGLGRDAGRSPASTKAMAAGKPQGTTHRAEAGPSISLLGSIGTSSSSNSVAIYGNLAYVCDNNEISIVNIANPSSLQLVGQPITNPLISNSPNIFCSIQRDTLVVFADQNNSTTGNTPSFLAFNLANPSSPQPIAGTIVNKRHFGIPQYIGNYAFVPTWAITTAFSSWQNQFGDLVSVDLTNFAAPRVASTLEVPQIDPALGGSTVVMGVTQADSALLYAGGSTSTLGPGSCYFCGNLGIGRLQVVDTSKPDEIKLVGQLLIPGTKQVAAPQIQGTVGVAIGNDGGFTGGSGANTFAGNVVVVTFDVSDRRQPSILSITKTNFKPIYDGGRSQRIGNNLFAFGGVNDASGNPVLLVVDATNPQAPAISSIAVTSVFTSIQAVGTYLYATLSSGGLAVYSIPGVNNLPPSVCPAITDTVLVLDRGAAMPAQSFLDAKTALKNFMDSLHLPTDHVAVVSFNTSAVVNQTLTGNSGSAKSSFDGIVAGGSSYLGSGISAAQAELTGPNHTAAAFQVMVILSDGSDVGAPNANASLAAASAAKQAGIRIISLQYGSTPNALMQSIASSTSDYRLIGQ